MKCVEFCMRQSDKNSVTSRDGPLGPTLRGPLEPSLKISRNGFFTFTDRERERYVFSPHPGHKIAERHERILKAKNGRHKWEPGTKGNLRLAHTIIADRDKLWHLGHIVTNNYNNGENHSFWQSVQCIEFILSLTRDSSVFAYEKI